MQPLNICKLLCSDLQLQVAYSESGEPSKALLGFCKKNGFSPEDTTLEADKKGVEYVWGVSQQKGLPAAEVTILFACSSKLSQHMT